MAIPTPPKRRAHGRPRTRTGDEVALSIEFPRKEYAQLAAYVAHRKRLAHEAGTPLAQESQRMTILGLWEAFWREQNPRVRRKLERSAEYRAALEP